MDIKKVYERVNDFIGDNVKGISKCQELYNILVKEKNEIESQLSIINNAIPPRIDETVTEVDEICADISNFTKDLEKSLELYEEGDMENTFEKLTSFACKRKEYSKYLNYFKILKSIGNTSLEIRKLYYEANWNKCILLYSSQLCSLLRCIVDTKCENLLNYLKNIILYWHETLRKKLTTEFEQLLKTLNWPFVIRNKSFPGFPSEDLKPKFQYLTKLLIEIELPEEMRTKPIVTSLLLMDFPSPSYPVSLLLIPMRKRFVFHFCGSKQTNRVDKPEWMFSQVLTWIKDHEIFLIDWMEPVYRGFTNMAKIEFISGLMKILTEKLQSDLNHLQYDDNLFTHTLDEILSFHREVTKHYGYPSTYTSVLCVLTQSQIFVKWLNMERKCAEKRMDDMLNSGTAWNTVVEDDNCKVTECADKFIILLSTITDRYSVLPQPGHRLQFLELQLDLIDEFRLRLAQLKRDDFIDALDSYLPAILNTVHYVSTVLTEWETNTHFIMLHHFKTKFHQKENSESISVFCDELSIMTHFADELIKEICNSVVLEIKAKSRPYRKDRWNTMPTINPNTDLSLTISSCAMFQVLNNKLFQMRDLIAPAIFKNCWRYVAECLCKLIIDDVILANMFSEGGAQQIQFDVKRNILALFGQFTPKAEAYFKPLIEACDLLCLPHILNSDNVPFEITALSKHHAEAILNRKLRKTIVSALDSL